ncbi:unnamed protein product [Closterium sp. Yama58-4]|nr:unnamed protein product [Closterium sp. Yama58-4]
MLLRTLKSICRSLQLPFLAMIRRLDSGINRHSLAFLLLVRSTAALTSSCIDYLYPSVRCCTQEQPPFVSAAPLRPTVACARHSGRGTAHCTQCARDLGAMTRMHHFSRAGASRAGGPGGAGEDASAASMSRARSVFLNAVLSEPEVVALREAELEMAAAGKGAAAAAEEEAQREVEEDDAPGRIGEEKLFSNMMHDEWLEYLYEEILLLRIERQNELLANQQQTAISRRGGSEGGPAEGEDAAGAGRGGGGKGVAGASAFSFASASTPAKAAIASNPSAPVPALLLHRPSQAASGPSHAVPAAAPSSTITDALSTAHPAHSPSSSPLHPAVAAAGGGAGLAGGRVAGRVGAVGMRRQRHKRVATIGSSVDLADLREEAARLDRSSGVEAAMVAAEAAVSGGRQMMRMWERMRRIMPSAGGVDVEDPTQSASPGSHPHLDDHAPDVSTPHHHHNHHHHHHAQQQAGQGEQQAIVVGPELLAALAKGQVTGEQRAKTWLAIACADPEDEIMSRRNYRNLLKQPSVSANEIQRDVNRTFPLHSMFQEEKGAGQKALFNVIKAYSVLDKEVGYCQGMGFIVATLLLLMGEEDAFCCLVFLLYKCGLRGVFLPDMQQLQVRMYQLSQLLIDAHPEVHAYFEELDVKPVMYAADWFLSLFARTMPHYIVFRVFDIIFADKTTAIVFKLGMVLLQVCERQLQQCPEMEYAMHFLRVELPLQLKEISEDYLEELVSKALRVHLPFDSLLRLEAEYELLAGEAAAAARHVRAAAAASEAAARSLECTRRDLEVRLHHALRARKQSHELAAVFKAAIAGLQQGDQESGTSEQSTQHSGQRQEQEHRALNGHEPETASEIVTADAANSATAAAAASGAPGASTALAAAAMDQAGLNSESETKGGSKRGGKVVRVSSRSSNEGALDLAVRYFEWKEWSEVAGNAATVAVLRQVEEARHACHETLTALAAAEMALAERAEQVAQEGEQERVVQEMVVVLEEGDEGGHADEFF